MEYDLTEEMQTSVEEWWDAFKPLTLSIEFLERVRTPAEENKLYSCEVISALKSVNFNKEPILKLVLKTTENTWIETSYNLVKQTELFFSEFGKLGVGAPSFDSSYFEKLNGLKVSVFYKSGYPNLSILGRV